MDTALRVPGWHSQACREHPDLAALPSRTSSCLALLRQDIPTSTTAFPSRMQERAVQQLGTYCKWHHLLLTWQFLCRPGHGDTWEQGLGHLLPLSCQEARALRQSPGLAVVVPAAGPGQETAAWAGGGAGLQLCVPRDSHLHPRYRSKSLSWWQLSCW